MQWMQQSPDGSQLAELLAFVAVAEELSFRRAGKRLNRDPTVISRRVTALEARLGARLLERSTRTVVLTESGQIYLERAVSIIRAIEAADQEASASGTGEAQGHLRIALTAAFGRLRLAPIIAEFLTAHPRVTIDADFSDRFVDLIAERFDLAVRMGALADSGLLVRKIGERGRLLCASPDYLERHGTPCHPDELANRPCLIFNGLADGPRWVLHNAAGQVARVNLSGPLASNDVQALVTAATAGLGVLLGADWLVGRELEAGTLVPVLPAWKVADEGGIYIVTPSGANRASKTRAFGDFLTERLAHVRAPPQP